MVDSNANPRTRITAHRGYRRGCAENTLDAFEQAIRRGADRLELDVHLTLDGSLVVHHHYSVRTRGGGQDLISKVRLDQLLSTVPTLLEVLELAGDSVELEIELRGVTRSFLDMVLNTVESAVPSPRVEFTSPHPFVLSHLRRAVTQAKLGMFVQNFPDWMSAELGERLLLETLDLGEIDVAHCPLAILNERLVTTLHRRGKQVHAADCNSKDELLRAFELGVDQLSTDELDLALEIRREIQEA